MSDYVQWFALFVAELRRLRGDNSPGWMNDAQENAMLELYRNGECPRRVARAWHLTNGGRHDDPATATEGSV